MRNGLSKKRKRRKSNLCRIVKHYRAEYIYTGSGVFDGVCVTEISERDNDRKASVKRFPLRLDPVVDLDRRALAYDHPPYEESMLFRMTPLSIELCLTRTAHLQARAPAAFSDWVDCSMGRTPRRDLLYR
jgi:hypothetical protein